MFDALVMPILLYRCEVWGTNKRLAGSADTMHHEFLKVVYKLPKCTDTMCMMAELGRTQISHTILARQDAL